MSTWQRQAVHHAVVLLYGWLDWCAAMGHSFTEGKLAKPCSIKQISVTLLIGTQNKNK